MNKQHVIDDLYLIMKDDMQLPHMDQFHANARLNQDLYLDLSLIHI